MPAFVGYIAAFTRTRSLRADCYRAAATLQLKRARHSNVKCRDPLPLSRWQSIGAAQFGCAERCNGPMISGHVVGSSCDEKLGRSNIVIEGEFVGMWPKANRFDFFLALVFDVRPQHFFGEDVSLQQERGIFLQSVQRTF